MIEVASTHFFVVYGIHVIGFVEMPPPESVKLNVAPGLVIVVIVTAPDAMPVDVSTAVGRTVAVPSGTIKR